MCDDMWADIRAAVQQVAVAQLRRESPGPTADFTAEAPGKPPLSDCCLRDLGLDVI